MSSVLHKCTLYEYDVAFEVGVVISPVAIWMEIPVLCIKIADF